MENLTYTKTEQFVLEQVPDIQICYHETKSGFVADWPMTLKMYLGCLKDYSKEIKELVSKQDYAIVKETINSVMVQVIKNGSLIAMNGTSLMNINTNLLRNRVSFKAYQALKNDVPPSKLRAALQSMISNYRISLFPNEERAICALYKACEDDNPNKEVNYSKDAVFEIAFTFLCFRLRKIYSVYERAVRKLNCSEDAILSLLNGFSTSLETFDFTTPIQVGLSPGYLLIPIQLEIGKVLDEANPVPLSKQTRKKIKTYLEEIENDSGANKLSIRELMEKYSITPHTAMIMQTYANGDILCSLEGIVENMSNHDDKIMGDSIVDVITDNQDPYFEIDLKETLKRVLDDDQLQVFNMIYFKGYNYTETAKYFNTSARRIKYIFELCRIKLKPIFCDPNLYQPEPKRRHIDNFREREQHEKSKSSDIFAQSD